MTTIDDFEFEFPNKTIIVTIVKRFEANSPRKSKTVLQYIKWFWRY